MQLVFNLLFLSKGARMKIIIKTLLIFCLLGFGTSIRANEHINTMADFAHVVDFETNRVLLSKNADSPMKPASMAKIMTLYIAFSRIAEGSLTLQDKFLVSEKAWKMGGSRSFLDVGTRVSVEELINGIAVQSGNDAAVVIAEGISGSEELFADEMNSFALQIGMKDTNFTNSTGWPDDMLTTTARDLTILTAALIRDFPINEFPYLYPVFAKPNYTYNNIKQPNRNPLINRSPGADGLKTGSTRESGYGLVGSAERNGQRIILVLNGLESKKQRSFEANRLMDFMFREYKNYTFFEAGETVSTANIWLGKEASIPLVLENKLSRVLSRSERNSTKLTVNYNNPIQAPVLMGDEVGTLWIEVNGVREEVPLIAGKDVLQLPVFSRVTEAIKYLIFGAAPSIN